MPELKVMVIYEPVANADATIDSFYERLCFAAGKSSGTQIAGIKALCEPLADQHSPVTYDCDYVNNNGVFVGYQSWSGSQIPGSHEGWNCLHVCTYFYGYPPAPTNHESVIFRGVKGTCSGGHLSARRARVAELFANQAAPGGIGEQLTDLVETWWERDAHGRRLLREPVDHDGAWMLYRNLPVDVPLGCILGLNGKPLRATSISVAADAVSIRRKLAPPQVHLAVPFGTGQAAGATGPAWNFTGLPELGVIIHQHGYLHDPPLDVTQVLQSVSRDSPMAMFVDPNSPIRVAVNSPQLEVWMNDGFINLWVKVNSR